ncbi:MAG TPA: hypothetical protein VNG51_12370 [Ktedonobacteraceae bacterium]|nr:hypothetical protein [Ktedonobacteraceae bacterium]
MTIRTALIGELLQEPRRNRPLHQVYPIVLRKATRNHWIFPSDRTVFKVRQDRAKQPGLEM